MRWQRLGRIWVSAGQRPWMISHASVPTPERIDAHHYRIYFTPRDGQGRSNVAWLVIDIREPAKVLDLSETPSLAPGGLGAFDDSGAMFSWIVRHEGRRWLYYVGWNLGRATPWRTAIGLAHADAHAAAPIFQRLSPGPILDRSTLDPYFVTNPFVRREANGAWRMWYLSGIGWAPSAASPLPRYNVRYAESDDGVHWRPSAEVAVDHMHPGEVAIGRPFVMTEEGLHKMFYSYRGDTFGYRMGYAESEDGRRWTRRDDAIRLDGPAEEWDSEGTAYPTVFDHDRTRYMLYCGNNYSRGGFGLAALVGQGR